MTLQTSGNICISDLKTEFSSSANCLTSYYAGGGIVPSGASGTNGAVPTSGTICLTDFYGVSNVIPVVSNTADNTGAEFVDFVSYSGGFGVGGISWQIVQESTQVGSNYVSKFYLERTSSAYSGVMANPSTVMSVGTLYPVQTTTFTTSNWPDSYYIDISTSVSATGLGQESFIQVAGSGEDYSSGQVGTPQGNWDSVVFTLIDPGTSGNSSPSTAFGISALTTGECSSYTAIWTSTLNFYYKKSGYPDLLAGTKTVYTEVNMSYSGICP